MLLLLWVTIQNVVLPVGRNKKKSLNQADLDNVLSFFRTPSITIMAWIDTFSVKTFL